MWKRVLLAGLFATACAGVRPRPPSAHVREVPRGDGSSVFVLWGEPVGTKRHPVLLYLSGSGCASAAPAVRYLTALGELGYAFIAPEKRGVMPGDTGEACSEEFLRTNRREQRLDDAKKAIDAASALFSRWDGRLIIVGASEGGVIAAELAAGEHRTAAVVSLAGGGLSQADELELLRRQSLEARGASEAERAASLAELEDTLEAIRRDPSSTRSWLGADNTYLRWASYLWYAPAMDFARVDVPTYVAHGTRDTSCPVESSDEIVEAYSGRANASLTYRRMEGLDHRWMDASGRSHLSEVLGAVAEWLLVWVPPEAPPPAVQAVGHPHE